MKHVDNLLSIEEKVKIADVFVKKLSKNKTEKQVCNILSMMLKDKEFVKQSGVGYDEYHISVYGSVSNC